jgi:integrase
VPIPHEIALQLNRVPAKSGSTMLVVGVDGAPLSYTIETAFKKARATVEGLPAGFRIHDLRHYDASLLAAALESRPCRHGSGTRRRKTTLDPYGHMWPDKDESARAAVSAAFADRPATRADSVRIDAASAQ